MDHLPATDAFLFGASTAPYAKATDWPIEEWDRDLRHMRELNFNTVRIFAAWDRIEIDEGVFDWHKHDVFMDLAAKHGIKVILQLGGLFKNPCACYHPRWLAAKPACHRWEKAPGVPVGGASPVCPDDPTHLALAREFMRRTIERYAPRPEIVAWMIWNEPDRRMPCYCPCTMGLFRDWLRDKYAGNLDALNRLWSSEAPVTFATWDDVDMTGLPTLNVRRDWLQFNQHRLVREMSDWTALVAATDPQRRPTTANLVYHHTAYEIDTCGPTLGLDVAGVGGALDVMGVSCYTVAHPFDPRPAYETAYKLSRLRSASRDPRRRTLVLETDAGPYVRMITDAQRRQRCWHLVAHNAKSILLWNYRSRLSDGQVAYFHLQKWDGSISRRARNMGDFAAVVGRHAEVLNRVYPARAGAVLVPEEQQVLSYLTHSRDYIDRHDSRFGAFKMLWDLQVPVDCLAENNLDEMDRYAVVLLPLVENMSAGLAARLRAYVEQGGTVIAESPFAFKDADNFLQYHAPGFGLDEVFGGWTDDREGWETAGPIQCPDGPAKVHFFWHEFTLAGGAALATYADGTPAVVANDFGKGRAVLAGTEVFRQYVQQPQAPMTALLRREILASGVRPTATLTDDPGNIEVARLTGPGGLVYLVFNHNPQAVRLGIEPADAGPWTDLETGETVDLAVPVEIPAEGCLPLLNTKDQ